MKSNESYRIEMVPARLIKRMPGLVASQKGVGKIKDFVRKRGHCRPVVLSDSDGCMTLLTGGGTFEACLEEKETKLPAVIVRTEGEADSLMFALQSAGLDDLPNAIAVGTAIVQLVDSHRVTRRQIAEALDKSSSWINRMESLSRRLSGAVQGLVAEGRVSARAAQEIARLPNDVQMAFAVSTSNEFLNKESVRYLVNRYLNEDTGAEERERIVYTPKLALPTGLNRRSRTCKDNSESARLAHAIARCMDGAACLSNLLHNIDIAGVAVRMPDIMALSDSLASLILQLSAAFPPGQSGNGQGGGCDD